MAPGEKSPMGTSLLLLGHVLPNPVGFPAFPPECLFFSWGDWVPPRHAGVCHRIPAAGSALRSHPCVALSSAQVKPVETELRTEPRLNSKNFLPKRGG